MERKGTIPLEDYLEIYVDKNTPKYEFLRDLIVQQHDFKKMEDSSRNI